MPENSDMPVRPVDRRGLIVGGLGGLGAAVATLAGVPASASAATPEAEFLRSSLRGAPSGVAAVDDDGNVLTGSPEPRILAELDRVDGISFVASPQYYPGIDPTGESDSSGALNDLIAGIPPGSTVIVPPGTYRIDESIVNKNPDGSTKSVLLIGYGATLLRTAGSATIVFRGGFEPIRSVAGGPRRIALAAQGSVDGNSMIPGTEIDLSPMPSEWRVGDVVKLVADDSAPGARVTNKSFPGGSEWNRVGQFLTIAEIDGSTLRMTGALRDDYTQNVRIGRVSDVSCVISGFTFDVTDEVLVNVGFSAEHIRLSSMVAPAVRDVRILRGDGAGVQLVSCYGFSVSNSVVQHLLDDPENKRFGYGVVNNQSFGGTVTGCVFSQVRHAFTDGVVNSAPDDSSLARYGRAEFTVVSDSVCTAATASAWNTHHGGRGTTFVDCTAIGGRNGFALRGKGHRILGGLARDIAGPAVAFYLDNAQADSDSHVVDGLTVDNAHSVLRSNLVGKQAASDVSNIRARAISRYVMDLGGTRLHADNWVVQMSETIDNQRDQAMITVARDGWLEGRSILIDCRASKKVEGAALVLIDAAGDESESQEIDLRDVVVRNLDGQFQRLVRSGPKARRFVEVEVDADFAPQDGDPVSSLIGAGGWVEYTVRDRPTSSGSIEVSGTQIASDSTSRAIALCRSTVFVSCDPDGSDRQLSPLLPGHSHGQMVSIRHSGSGSTITVADGGEGKASLSGGRDVTLQPGQTLSLAWLPVRGESRWVQVGSAG